MMVPVTSSLCAQYPQPVQPDGFRREGVEFDFCDLPLGSFSPAVNPRVGLFADVAGCRTQEIARIDQRNSLSRCRPGERFNDIAAQEFRPVRIEKLRRSEDIAPSHLAAVSDDHPDHTLAPRPAVRAMESAVNFLGEGFDRGADG